MQKLKIEEDFAEKAKLVQLELEKEREKAKSEKEKYETEKAKLEHERKKLEQLQMEIWEREERNVTPVNNKHPSNSDISLSSDIGVNNKSLNVKSSSKNLSATTTDSVISSSATHNATATLLSINTSEQASLELHESIHSLQQPPTPTSSELLKREKQLVLQEERLKAMQAQLNGKSSGNRTGSTSEVLQFLTEKEKVEEQKVLLEKAKFSAESKER